MTKEQIKQIVRLTEAVVAKKLNENRSSKISGASFTALENALVDNPKTNKQYERFVSKVMKRNGNADLWDDVSLADYELTYKFMKNLAMKNGINETISRNSKKTLSEAVERANQDNLERVLKGVAQKVADDIINFEEEGNTVITINSRYADNDYIYIITTSGKNV